MRLISSGFAVLLLTAAAGATPITLTFSGTASGSVNSVDFSNQAFSFTFTSDTTDLFTIPTGEMDAGDITTPNLTPNYFTIGTTYTGKLTGMPTFGPAVFLNPTTNNVGIWYFETADWLTTASAQYTSSYGLANNLTVTGLSPSNNGAFGNNTTPGFAASPMESNIGPVNITSLSDVTFTELLGSTSGPSGVSGASGPTGPTGPTGSLGSSPGESSATPEPSTLVMLGIGIAGIALGKLRRRRA